MIVRCFEGGPFQENAYLVSCPVTGRAAAVDPGGGTPALLEAVARDGLDLEAILLTHAHLDHVDGIPGVRQQFPDVPVYLHPRDRPIYDAAPEQAALFGLPAPDLPPETRDLKVGVPFRIGEVTLDVRLAPGHAPGHVLFLSRSLEAALVGDVIFRGSIGRTDLPGGDTATLLNSIREEILTLPGETRLYPGHGPDTTVEMERRSNPFVLQMLHG